MPFRKTKMGKMIIVGMCTIPERLNTLEKVIISLSSQVDRIELALNGFKSVPKFLSKYPNVKPTLTTNEMGDANKFFSISKYPKAYYLSCDDDILYPKDYVKVMVREAKKHKCLVTVHGSNIPGKVKNYYSGKIMRSHCLNTCSEAEINIPGSGVSCFDTSIVRIDYKGFKYPNMADIWLGVQCEKKGIRRIAIAHKKGWIAGDLNKGRTTIYEQHKNNCQIQTRTVNSVKWKNI